MDDDIPITRLDPIPVTRLDSIPVTILDPLLAAPSAEEEINQVFRRRSIEENKPINVIAFDVAYIERNYK